MTRARKWCLDGTSLTRTMKPRRIKQPWDRALKRFMPFGCVAIASSINNTYLALISLLLAYGWLWMDEEDKEREKPFPENTYE